MSDLAEDRAFMYAVAKKVTQNHHDAEDVVQEVMVRIAESKGKAWLYTVVRNRAFDLMRQKVMRANARMAVEESTPSIEEELLAAESWVLVSKAIEELKPSWKQAVKHRLESTKPPNTSESSFRQTLHRAYKAIREKLHGDF